MAASQFTVYSSSDPSGPGLLTGQAGSLISLLDAILINGYAGKAAGGGSAWSHPVATSGNIATYKAPSGSQMTLLVNDNGPNVTSTYKEAWVTGWETCAGVGAPVGTGTGQFPMPAQSLTTGKCVVRKSATVDTVGRYWVAFADAYTFYLFIQAEGTNLYNGSLFWGDIFSFAGSADAYRCVLGSGQAENSTQVGSNTYNSNDHICTFAVTVGNSVGRFMPRNYSGFGASITCFQIGDISKTANTISFTPITGIIQCPNAPDNTLYMSAIGVGEHVSLLVRGRVRGLYQVCHPIGNFVDGQIIYGANDFSGKTFQIVKPSGYAGYWAVETSNTVETN
jgi:hypothetical protein